MITNKNVNYKKENLLFLPEKDYSDILNDYSLSTINSAANSIFKPIYTEIAAIILNLDNSFLEKTNFTDIEQILSSELERKQISFSKKITISQSIGNCPKEQSKTRRDHCVSSCLNDILPKSVFSLSSDIIKRKNISFFYESGIPVSETHSLDSKATIASKIISFGIKSEIINLSKQNIKHKKLMESCFLKQISPSSFSEPHSVDKKSLSRDFCAFINSSLISSMDFDFNNDFGRFLILSEFLDVKQSLQKALAASDLISNKPREPSSDRAERSHHQMQQ